MKRILLVSLLHLTVFIALGQQDTTFLTLDQAIEKALQQRYEIKIQHNNVRIYENEQKKAGSRYLPQVTGDLDLRYNSQLQTNIIPAGIFGPEERKIQFGTRYNTIIAFNLVQPILNLQTIEDKKIAKVQTSYQELNEKLIETQIRQDVTEAYLSALLWKERVRISEINVKRTNAISLMSESQLKEGVITSYDFQRSRLDAENAKAEHQKNQQNLTLSMKALSYKIESGQELSSFSLEDINKLYGKMAAGYLAAREVNRTELLMEKTQKEIYDLNTRKQRQGLYPTIHFYANCTFLQLTNTFNPFSTGFYYPYNFLGIKASLPIYNGGLRERTKMEFLLRSESSRLTYEKLKNDYAEEMEDAITGLSNAEQDLNYQKKNLEIADELYKIDSSRFSNGAIRQTELNTTYYTLQQTQNNYITALYNYLVSMVKYKKAAGAL